MSATSSNLDSDQAAIDRHRGRFVPWIIAAFYLTFMTALISFVFIAYAHPPSEVTTEAYEKGLAYNNTLAKSAAQQALGWTSAIAYSQGRVTLTLQDNQHKPITQARARAWFVHPDNHAMDRSFDLQSDGGGVYSAAANLPDTGQWTVHVTAALGTDEYQSLATVTVE